MKTKIYIVFLLSAILASCSSLQQTSFNDDLYYSPKDDVVTKNEVKVKTNYVSSANKIDDQNFEEKISAVLDDDSKGSIDTVIYESDETGNPYEDIVVRDRDEAYQKRLDGFSNPYYGFSNYGVYMSDAYWYASAYDPYFYNIVIMGDQVWVEPRYISASFGYWPRHAYSNSWNYGYWNDPFYYGYSPYYYSYYSPYYYSPYYNYGNSGYHANNNYVGSSFHSYRQRSLASRWGAQGNSLNRNSRSGSLSEEYMGRGVSRSSTVKDGLNRQTTRTSRSSALVNGRTGREGTAVTRTSRSGNASSTNRTYTRTSTTRRSTYSTSRGTTTRYNRPSSTSVNSGRSSNTRGSSTYSTSRSTNRSSSGSSYRPSSSSRSSGNSSSVRSSGTSRSSGSVRSSGSSSRSSSGSSNRSSGSSRSRR